MLYNKSVVLLTISQGTDEYGDLVETVTASHEIMADRESAKRSEFYQGMTAGAKPEVVFKIRAAEYDGQPQLDHEGLRYRIIRTFTKDDELLELICSQGVRP